MSFYKFTENDLFVNQLETNPHCRFDIYNSKIYYNNKSTVIGAFTRSVPSVEEGHISLYELNVDRNPEAGGTGMIFPFLTKDGSKTAFKTISTSDYYSTEYGTAISPDGMVVSGAAYPLSASITREFFDLNHSSSLHDSNSSYIDFSWDSGIFATPADHVKYIKENLKGSHLQTLRNTINRYSVTSPHFQYSSSTNPATGLGEGRDLSVVPVNLISVPGIFYGSKIQRGSVDLKYYITGTLVGHLHDRNQNGELIQIGPEDSPYSGSVAGLVLYKQGFVILTGSWDLTQAESSYGPSILIDYKDEDIPCTSSWLYFAVGANDSIPVDSKGTDELNSRTTASYALEFSGTNEIPVMTMFAHAQKGHLNYSNNPTYLSHSGNGIDYRAVTSSMSYYEPDLGTTNIVSSSFVTPTASFAKETYISKIGLYDKNRNLIGVTTVSKPIKKTEDREFTFKLKLDI
jgi:hypothetical protein